MSKLQKIIIVASVMIGLAMLGGALIISANRQDQPLATTKVVRHTVTKAELKQADGRDGHDCYVAVDGTVYQIKDFSLWQDGQHSTSNGLAYCGADLSKVIDQSPHGRKILDILIKIGPLK